MLEKRLGGPASEPLLSSPLIGFCNTQGLRGRLVVVDMLIGETNWQ
jgi:hypothetical protein